MGTNLPTTQKPGAISPSESKPAFLRDKEIKGVDELTKFVRPPFVKIVQGASAADLKEEHPEGSVLLVPGNDLVCEPGEPLIFTPLKFWQEFLCVNPIELKGQIPMVHERSFDPAGEIAARCYDPDRRMEQMLDANGQPWLVKSKPIYRSYQDTRVFLIMIHGPRCKDTMAAMTFSRGELRSADRLATLIGGRQSSPFYCVFEGLVGTHRDKGGQYTWLGFDFNNPSDVSPWISSEQQCAQYEKMHDLLTKAFEDRRIQVDQDFEPASSVTTHADPDGIVEADAAF